MKKESKIFIDTYLKSLSETERKKYQSFSSDYFCADEYNANLCAKLVLDGKKTATSSLKYWYESDKEPIPKVGHLQVVTTWSGEPICLIEIVLVEECKYCDVTASFAYCEGEGDRSLKWWQNAHWDFFIKECKELNITPSKDMMLVLEKFRVVYSS